jgi:glycosyltransferase involved in cell wall biosynthesis
MFNALATPFPYSPPLLCTQVTIGRFHHFHLARQLEKHQLLDSVNTGYPLWKLSDEDGIPNLKIHAFPWIQAPYMARGKFCLDRWTWLNHYWAWLAHESLDRHVAKRLTKQGILIALSGSGLYSGKRMQELGGYHICDRGSTHIDVQNKLLNDEYKRYGLQWPGIDHRILEKEKAEYAQADFITVPSQFCVDSFTLSGLPRNKIIKLPYGVKSNRFHPVSPVNLLSSRENFTILFVGHASARKGFIDLLNAYRSFGHPSKQLLLIGTLSPEAQDLLARTNLDGVEYLGIVPNSQLSHYYSRASVFVLPSIEEGLAMVIGEAMGCGCPVIASDNTGASELISDGINGFVVPIRRPDIIADRLHRLADEPRLREQMGVNAAERMSEIQGWDRYGDMWKHFIESRLFGITS